MALRSGVIHPLNSPAESQKQSLTGLILLEDKKRKLAIYKHLAGRDYMQKKIKAKQEISSKVTMSITIPF